MDRMTRIFKASVFAAALWAASVAVPALAQGAFPPNEENEAFRLWLNDFSPRAAAAEISRPTIDAALGGLYLDYRVLKLDRRQPESSISFASYIDGILTKSRVIRGREMLSLHRRVLDDLQRRYGVAPAVIVALWGVESGYGANTGDFDIIRSLATLAFEGRRAEFFGGELIEALRIVDSGQKEANAVNGSWAGALGQFQFMPSTYSRYAVDYDGDGRRDIWDNPMDALASAANYLAAEGWVSGQDWGAEIRWNGSASEDEIGLKASGKSVDDWERAGARILKKGGLSCSPDGTAYLVLPDGRGGRAFLACSNLKALMRWNRSTNFALSIGLLADAIAAAD